MRLTIDQVADLLRTKHRINTRTFDKDSTKPFATLEEEYRKNQVRFVPQQDGTVLCLRSASRIIVIDRIYKYPEVTGLHRKSGDWISDEMLKDYTVSGTGELPTGDTFDADATKLGEDGRQIAEREFHEETGTDVHPDDFGYLEYRITKPRASRVYLPRRELIKSVTMETRFVLPIEKTDFRARIREKGLPFDLFDDHVVRDKKAKVGRIRMTKEERARYLPALPRRK